MAKRGSKMAKVNKKKVLSRVKMSNIRKNKHAKRGELTTAQKNRKKIEKKERKKVTFAELRAKRLKHQMYRQTMEEDEEIYPLHAEISGEEMMKMMDPEDLTYMVEIEEKKVKQLKEEAEKKEGSLEEQPRSFEMHPDKKELLPIKTDQGIVHRYTDKTEEQEDEKDKSGDEKEQEKQEKEELGEEEEEEQEEKEEEVEEEKEEEVKKKQWNNIANSEPVVKSTIEFVVRRQKKLEEKKIKIGCLAANFLAEPEERLAGLSSLVHFMEENDQDVAITVKKYAALSLLEVFNNIIPAYPIRHNSLDTNKKLKKEVEKLVFYEKHILMAYQIYLKGLEDMLRQGTNTKHGENSPYRHMGLVALKCMGELLVKHNHFNYTINIIQAFVPFLNSSFPEYSAHAKECITKVFRTDRKAFISYEIVRRIDQFIRKRRFSVQPLVLGVFLGLRLKEVESVDEQVEAIRAAKKKLTRSEKLIRKATNEQQMKQKSKKQAKFMRKKRKLEEQRKGLKEQRNLRKQSTQHMGIIELVFGLYIHVLKRRPNQKLIGIVLEGLAKFAHLVNIEFFGDLLNVLGELMAEGTLQFRESLHCIQVVFTILAGQGQVLTLDPQRFFIYLYNNMFRLSAGRDEDDVQSVLESIRQILGERRRHTGTVRVLAFGKRLASLSLHQQHHGAITTLATLRTLFLGHPCTEALLETSCDGTSGVFSPEVQEPEHSNAAASCLWELHLLNRHYHPAVRQVAKHLMHGVPLQGEHTLPYTITKQSIEELYESFSPAQMRFVPAVPAPNQHLSSRITSRTNSQAKRRREDSSLPDVVAAVGPSILQQAQATSVDFSGSFVKRMKTDIVQG